MSGHPCAVLRGHTDYVTSVAAFQDNSNDFIISSSWDREVRIWDAEKALVLNIITFHPRPVNALCTYFDEKGKRRMVISGSDDSNCRVFDPFYGGSEPAGILRGPPHLSNKWCAFRTPLSERLLLLRPTELCAYGCSRMGPAGSVKQF